MYRAYVARRRASSTCVAGLRLAPPAPWIAKEVHGKPIVALFVCYSGPLADAERRDRARSRPSGTPVGDIVQKRSYVSQQMLLDATQPQGPALLLEVGVPARDSSRTLFARAIEHAARIVSPHSAILIFPLDGALNGCPRITRPSATATRPPCSTSRAPWEHAKDDAQNIEWARATWRDLRQFSTGGTYINFLTEDEGDDRTRAAYRTNYERLVEVKAGGIRQSVPDEQEHRASEVMAGGLEFAPMKKMTKMTTAAVAAVLASR